MTFDVKQNNWILPLKGEEFYSGTDVAHNHAQSVREHGMAIKIAWQPAVTFNMLNAAYWPHYFSQMKLPELKRLCALLDVEVHGSKNHKLNHVHALSEHYRDRFDY